MKRIIIFFLLLFITGLSFAGSRQMKLPSVFEAQVIHVVDGDTFRFKASLLNIDINDTCRMQEYNAPEMHGVEKLEGEKAKSEMIRLIGGKSIRITTRGQDKYGRWLCTASTGTVSIGVVMREYLKNYPGRDKYLKHSKHVTTFMK